MLNKKLGILQAQIVKKFGRGLPCFERQGVGAATTIKGGRKGCNRGSIIGSIIGSR